jgi:toxin FitB
VSGFLLDSNIPSETMKPRPESKVERWLEDAEDAQLFLSVISLAEIFGGIAYLPDSQKRAQLKEWIDAVLRPWFAGRLLPVTESIAERLGRWVGAGKVRGITIGMADGLIAAHSHRAQSNRAHAQREGFCDLRCSRSQSLGIIPRATFDAPSPANQIPAFLLA